MCKGRVKKKSRIRETPTLSIDADIRTDTNLKRLFKKKEKKKKKIKKKGGKRWEEDERWKSSSRRPICFAKHVFIKKLQMDELVEEADC